MELNTPRLTMRPIIPADAVALFETLGDPHVMRFSVAGAHQSVADTAGWIEHGIRHQSAHGFAMYAVLRRCDGDIVGQCGLEVLADGRTEIGYRLRRDQWGRGYAAEAAKAWLDYGFSTLRLSRIVAMIEPGNRRSIRVAEKIGMQAGASETFHGIPVIAYFAEAPATPDGARSAIRTE
ncbi:GNAT family N-acetyltransferase [Methylocapsa sp. S129]|uniref:GNAT family N-acetyltransferase n=1 Tax=Methylocapsa sp. S129 TaxID=1641869 RepID=UPI00131B2753|nr:GNAT family N-acetyltransferase [Methylocapsa sp. S129]